MLKPHPLLAFFFAASLSAWGVQGHRLVAATCLKDLPPEVAAWFAARASDLPDHAIDPDHGKWKDSLEAPRHFLDSEPYGGAAAVPLSEATAQGMLGPDLFQKSGKVPWVILARVDTLTRAFRAYDLPQAALEAAYLSHYAGDINVPLHTTVNYDGDDTGQHGIHQRWETGLLERIVAQEGWEPEVRPATLGDDPGEEPWAWLQESYTLVPGLLADDLTARKASAGAFDSGYWEAFSRLQESHVKEQINLAAQRTARMILLAWTNAGSPAGPPPAR